MARPIAICFSLLSRRRLCKPLIHNQPSGNPYEEALSEQLRRDNGRRPEKPRLPNMQAAQDQGTLQEMSHPHTYQPLGTQIPPGDSIKACLTNALIQTDKRRNATDSRVPSVTRRGQAALNAAISEPHAQAQPPSSSSSTAKAPQITRHRSPPARLLQANRGSSQQTQRMSGRKRSITQRWTTWPPAATVSCSSASPSRCPLRWPSASRTASPPRCRAASTA